MKYFLQNYLNESIDQRAIYEILILIRNKRIKY